MPRSVLEIHEDETERIGLDAVAFARDVRQFALDAHAVLGRADIQPGDLIRLHGRVFRLLQEVSGAPTVGIRRWLLAVRARIGARLQSWSLEDLEAWVA